MTGTGQDRSDARVLIVGAPASGGDELGRALRARGLETVLAGTAAAADGCLARERVDLVVVHDPLPDGGAEPWIGALRERGSHVPVVYRSSGAEDEAVFERLTRRLGVRLVLRDPVEPNLVAEQLISLLEGPGRVSASSRASLAEDLAALRREYAATLPERLDELAEATRLARQRPEDEGAARRLRDLAHRLRGTAGTLGFTAVSEAAGQIEDAVDPPAEGAATVAEERLVRVEAALARVRAALDGMV